MWWIILLLFVLILIIVCAYDDANAALQRQIDDLKRTQEQETEGWATAYVAPAEWGMELKEVLFNENGEDEEITLEAWVVICQRCHRDALYYHLSDPCPYCGSFVF